MKELELDIKANNKDWLYEQYINKQRGYKDIALECGTTEDAIRKRLNRFGIQTRNHKEALEIRNKKFPNKMSQEKRIETNNKLRTGKEIKCTFCDTAFYINKKSKRKFCSIRCRNLFLEENRKRSPDWRDWTEYKEWRKLVYFRDGWRCRICGSKKDINAHHIEYGKENPNQRFNTENGITLCKVHHIQVHSPNSKELLLKNPNFGGSLEVDNPEASLREYLKTLIRSND